MKRNHGFDEMLEVPSPWTVSDVHYDVRRARVDIWIQEGEVRSGWFLKRGARAAAGEERVWRHVDLAGWRCFIHLRAPLGQTAPNLSWCGEPDMPFTGALARKVATMLAEGIKLPVVCAVLNIPIDELWKFKFGLETGRASAGVLVVPLGDDEDRDAYGVPPPQHPVWQHLLEGSVELRIRVLSLKLLLARLREQMRLIADPEVRTLKAQEIRRYFIRYAPLLGEELAQLRSLGTPAATRRKS